jgi:hypothetical protein
VIIVKKSQTKKKITYQFKNIFEEGGEICFLKETNKKHLLVMSNKIVKKWEECVPPPTEKGILIKKVINKLKKIIII